MVECRCQESKIVQDSVPEAQTALDREADSIRNIFSEDTYEKLWFRID